MGKLGDIGVISSDTSFSSVASRPTLPGVEANLAAAAPAKSRAGRDDGGAADLIAANLANTLKGANERVASLRSSTTLASLAHAYEAVGDVENAVASANEALSLCRNESVGRMLDPISARLAIDLLLRAGELDGALAFAKVLPLEPHARLSIGAFLASEGQHEEAHSFVDTAEVPERNAVLGYLFLSEGKHEQAAKFLRAALRHAPSDADSAHNLSIALAALGSHRKAAAAALQATRSAPGRQDVSLHYLDMLLADREFERVDQEIVALAKRGIAAPARLLITHARARLGLGDFDRAERLLERAAATARKEDDNLVEAEVLSNLSRLRAFHHKVDRDVSIRELIDLHKKFPMSEVAVVNLAQVTHLARHAEALANAYRAVSERMTAARRAFVEFQIATLSGDNENAANKSLEWLKLEPSNEYARAAAIVALGIGAERWAEAAEIGLRVLQDSPTDATRVNNVAYVLAMNGQAHRAIEIIEKVSDRDFVLNATLGMAYLAAGVLDKGMRLYREAADEAEKRKDDSRILMTAYQALIVRQLGLLESNDPLVISATSLPPMALPDDWRDRPEFLRLHSVAKKRGLAWPLGL